MSDIKPCLWFHADAEEAARFYVSVFPGSRIAHVMRGAPDAPAIAVDFVLDGQPFLALNGRPERGFTDAHSYVVPCDTQAEIDRYWDALVVGGQPIQCGWLKDKYGVAWQIAPAELPGMLKDKDSAKATRVMLAMCAMVKLDWAALQRAYDGN